MFLTKKTHCIYLQEFEDLDEIVARYIQPMASFTRDILQHKYYRNSNGGKLEMLDKLLFEEKKKAPSKYDRKVYCLDKST
jgi:hypothetical protein